MMNYNEIMAAARDQVGPYCKACPVCNGRACGNAMPGPGCKYPGNAAARNFDKWQEICVNMDTLCPNADPDVRFEMFGRSFAAPISPRPSAPSTCTTGRSTRTRNTTASSSGPARTTASWP